MNVIRKAVRSRFCKGLPRKSEGDLLAILSDRSDWSRACAIMEMGCRPNGAFTKVLYGIIGDQSPAIRRQAAATLGKIGRSDFAEPLLERARVERVDMTRFAMCVAAVQCGADREQSRAVLAEAGARRLHGAYGSKTVGGLAGFGVATTDMLWGHIFGSGGETNISSHARAREVLGFEPENRYAVISLAVHCDRRDFDHLHGLWLAAGRRMRLTLVMAMGLHGDPRWLPFLVDALTAMDVDPAHGFALRSEAATALGRLGLKEGQAHLVRALENEALDHEGRPGAGLGIQRPVRTHILGALGELEGPSSVLLSYLGNTHGTVTGGFYLSAMYGLWKAADASVLRKTLNGPALPAANALGVLVALEGAQVASAWRQDSRELVRLVAETYSDVEVIDVP